MTTNLIKRVIALLTIAFGAFFTAMMLLQLWLPSIAPGNYPDSSINKLIPTTGILSTAFLALLAVLKLIEEKK